MKEYKSAFGIILLFVYILMLAASIMLVEVQDGKVLVEVQDGKALSPVLPITTENPEVPLDELQRLLKPLTVKELEVEALGWLNLLKFKVRKISATEIAVKHKKEEIEKIEEVKD